MYLKQRKTLAVALISAWILLLGCDNFLWKKQRLFNQAEDYYQQEQFAQARSALAEALDIDANYAEAYYLLGLISVKEGNISDALRFFERVTLLKPDHIDAQIRLANLLFQLQKYDQAMKLVARVLENHPDNTDALLLKSSVLLTEKNTPEARRILDKLLDKGISNPDLYRLRALAYLQRNELKNAEDIIKIGLDANPKSVKLHLALAELYMRTERPEDAITYLLSTIELEAENVSHRMTLANLYWNLDRKEEAVAELNVAAASNPDSETTWIQIAQFYMTKNQPQEALRELNAGIDQIPQSYRLRFVLGNLYLQLNNINKALETIEACLAFDADPENPNILQTKNALAKIHLALGQIKLTEKYLDEVLQVSPDNAEARVLTGRIHLLRRNYPAAVSDFRTAVFEQPGLVAGYLYLAEAHLLNGNIDSAIGSLNDALGTAPASKEVLNALYRVHVLIKDYRRAEAYLKRLLEINPNDFETQARLGDFYVSLNEYENAKRQYGEIKRKAPRLPLGYLKTAQYYQNVGQLKAAIYELAQGYQANPNSADLLESLINVLVSQGLYDQATQICNARVEQNPREAFTINLLGKIHVSKKDYAKAEQYFNQAIELQPEWHVPHNNLASTYLLQDRKKSAIQKYETSLSVNPQNPSAYTTLAFLYEQSGDYAKARQTYEKALQNIPRHWLAANNLAYLIAEHYADSEEELNKALSLAALAQKIKPGELIVLDTIGWVYHKMGNQDQALAVYEKLVEAAPDNQRLNYHMGMVLNRMGRSKEAAERLQTALKSDRPFTGRKEAEQLLKQLNTNS